MPLYQVMEPIGLTFELIKRFVEYKKATTEKERERPEWKSLEKQYMTHLEWRLNYPKKIFGQQLISSWLITFLVLLLVLSGLTFSFLQLYSALKLGDFSKLTTELAIQTAGKVSISSSVVGAVVLVISLAFFYLYLKHVFQIKHPIPPHVSLAETDAASIWRNKKNGETKDEKDKSQTGILPYQHQMDSPPISRSELEKYISDEIKKAQLSSGSNDVTKDKKSEF